MEFRFTVDTEQLAKRLNQSLETVYVRAKEELAKLSIATHAFVVQKANQELTGYLRKRFFGVNNQNVRWAQISPSMWIVEIDPSVAWIERGLPRRFMSWLLDRNPKVKTSQFGVRYAHIPFKHLSGTKTAGYPALAGIVRNALQQARISMNRIERHPDGSPKLGTLHKLHLRPPFSRAQAPFLFSTPRTSAEAWATGLPVHGGIYKLKGLRVVQRLDKRGKVVREAVTFRTISEKHRGWRWMYPEIKGLHAMDAAYQWAQKEWESVIKALELEFNHPQ